jgi:uncharacterized protein (TIGR00369 family)
MTDKPKKQYDIAAIMNENIGVMRDVVPWANETGFRVTKVEKGHVWGVQRWAEHLVGDPETGIIHGGVITTFLDNLSGMACTAAMTELRFVATIDLRIDYMRAAEKGRDIIGEAECYHLTRTVCFTRAWAYHESRDRLIASSQGTFAINKPRLGDQRSKT